MNTRLAPASPPAPPARTYDESTFDFAPSQAVSKETVAMQLGLYRGYVEQTNLLIDALRLRRGTSDTGKAARDREALSRRLAFELNGLTLHECLFEQMEQRTGDQGPAAGSRAMESMDVAFGGYQGWRADIELLAKTRGVGWVVSLWDPAAEYLMNAWVDLHHLSVPAGQRLVFVLDLWEHAYWDDFGAKGREAYVDAAVGHTNWGVVERRLEGWRAVAVGGSRIC